MSDLFSNKKRLIKLIIIILLLAIALVIGTLYERNNQFRDFFDKYVFFKEKHENNLPKISIDSEKGLNIFAYKNNILILKDNLLTIYNQNGSVENTLEIEISNPIFNSSGDYICIAEKNGKKIYVLSNKNIVWQKDLENSISDIAINSNGYLAVSLSGTIYKTIIQTFDNRGNYLFKTFLSHTYVVDMEISSDNKYIAVAEVNISGILVQSNIKIISVDKAKNGDSDYIIYTHASESGDLIVNLKYESGNELVCVFDNHIEVIKNNSSTTVASFENEDVLFVDINNKIIKIVKENSNVFLQIMNTAGNYKAYEIKEPKEIHAAESITAINLGSQVLFYNNSGWLTKKYYATQEINKIVLSGNLAGIVYNDKIELISF